MNYIKILRPINLLIVALTQYSIFYLLLYPIFLEWNFPPVLGNGLIHLFVLATILISAGGFVINDIVDYDIDIVNTPDKIFIGDEKIPFNKAKIYYWSINILGLIISLYIGYRTDRLPLVIIYPISVAVLYYYSTVFKGKMLIGNIIVALFSMFVSGIIFFAEWSNWSNLLMYNQRQFDLILYIAIAYMFFGFFSSMYREIIKDIEDFEGDKKLGLSTLPIKVGIPFAKMIALFMIICLTANYTTWGIMIKQTNHPTFYLVFIIISMFLPTLYLIHKTVKAKSKKEFHQLSQWTKVLMLVSIILFVIICIFK